MACKRSGVQVPYPPLAEALEKIESCVKGQLYSSALICDNLAVSHLHCRETGIAAPRRCRDEGCLERTFQPARWFPFWSRIGFSKKKEASMSNLRAEIIESQKVRSELLKWKLLIVSALGAAGLGFTPTHGKRDSSVPCHPCFSCLFLSCASTWTCCVDT